MNTSAQIITNTANPTSKPNDECQFKTVAFSRKDSLQPQQQSQHISQREDPLLDTVDTDGVDLQKYMPVVESGIEKLKRRYNNQAEVGQKHLEHVKQLQELMVALETSKTQVMYKQYIHICYFLY